MFIMDTAALFLILPGIEKHLSEDNLHHQNISWSLLLCFPLPGECVAAATTDNARMPRHYHFPPPWPEHLNKSRELLWFINGSGNQLSVALQCIPDFVLLDTSFFYGQWGWPRLGDL